MTETQIYYREHGICPQCGQNEIAPNRKYCLNCLDMFAVASMKYRANMTDEQREKERQRSRNRRKALCEERKAAGLCVDCGKPARQGKTRCAMCADKMNKKQKERYYAE